MGAGGSHPGGPIGGRSGAGRERVWAGLEWFAAAFEFKANASGQVPRQKFYRSRSRLTNCTLLQDPIRVGLQPAHSDQTFPCVNYLDWGTRT